MPINPDLVRLLAMRGADNPYAKPLQPNFGQSTLDAFNQALGLRMALQEELGRRAREQLLRTYAVPESEVTAPAFPQRYERFLQGIGTMPLEPVSAFEEIPIYSFDKTKGELVQTGTFTGKRGEKPIIQGWAPPKDTTLEWARLDLLRRRLGGAQQDRRLSELMRGVGLALQGIQASRTRDALGNYVDTERTGPAWQLYYEKLAQLEAEAQKRGVNPADVYAAEEIQVPGEQTWLQKLIGQTPPTETKLEPVTIKVERSGKTATPTVTPVSRFDEKKKAGMEAMIAELVGKGMSQQEILRLVSDARKKSSDAAFNAIADDVLKNPKSWMTKK